MKEDSPWEIRKVLTRRKQVIERRESKQSIKHEGNNIERRNSGKSERESIGSGQKGRQKHPQTLLAHNHCMHRKVSFINIHTINNIFAMS